MLELRDTSGLDAGLSRLRALAPQGYALGMHIRFASALFMVQTYPPGWIEDYTRKGYMLCDPIVSWGFANEGVCRWSALDFPDPHDILGQGRAHGLVYGVAVSHGELSSRSIGGFARSDREFSDREIAAIDATVRVLHASSTPPESLPAGQRQALILIARGSRHAEAAAILGISESALKARLRAVRERLFTRTTVEAIQKAQEYKLI